MKLNFDKELDIALCKSRKDSIFKNVKTKWSDFLDKLKDTHRTHETFIEYMKMPKSKQDDIKDVGGFVGGYLENGSRKNIKHRQIICLDADFGKMELWDDWELLYGNASCMYTTHKHSNSNTRFRLLIPLDRVVTGDEYQAISRMIAYKLGIDYFDDTTYQANRLMYFPSSSKDAEFIFKYIDGAFLKADDILKEYVNWKDSSSWPVSSRVVSKIQTDIKKQEDPHSKKGMIGAFCRTYTIHEVIEKYLSDEYKPCDIQDRYTYMKGSTSAGLVTYDDKYAFSHHSTDPCCGMLCNAFDLVRLHKFGGLDDNAKENTPANKLPSYVAISEMLSDDEKVKLVIVKERLAEAHEDFDIIEDTAWIESLSVSKKGDIECTIDNVVLILENDPLLKGKLGFNEFEHREVALKDLPWREIKGDSALKDSDDAEIRYFLEKNYKIVSTSKIKDAIAIVVSKHKFHPIKDYLESCTWDGVKRVERLLIDYLGAEDSDYVKAVTKKVLCAGIARIYNPGAKFDNVLVIVGRQGIGKSQLINRLGGAWYSDSLTTVSGKEAYEQLQGVWIMEMGELAAMKKAEVEATKHFISKQEDRYRVAYGHRVESFPRQTIFVGTTNEDSFLRDSTGNRRFWPVDCKEEIKKSMWNDLDKNTIKKIWAEAMLLWKDDETLYLDNELEKVALEKQESHKEENPKEGMIQEYLDILLPADWENMDLGERRSYIQDSDITDKPGFSKRDKVCTLEIWAELFNGDPKKMNLYDSREINKILDKIPGWKKHDNQARFGKLYGKQRAYRRQL